LKGDGFDKVMGLKIHFMAGLPRSGSTLLAGILRQNPRLAASMQSPVADIFSSALKGMSGFFESSIFLSDEQRVRILTSLFEAYYAGSAQERVIFDNHRSWCLHISILVRLFPEARMICCVRSPAWILDSIERHIQKSALQPSRMFNYDPGISIYHRVEHLMKSQMVGPSLNALRQAWFGEHARRLIAIRYESLTQRPAETIARLYDLLGEEQFVHDFNHVEYDASEFDAWLGLPGFHKLTPKVQWQERATILPVDLFRQYEKCFWESPENNPRDITIL
jgi:sulfotransferase